MKINFSTPLTSLTGEPLEELKSDGKTKKPILLRDVAINALMSLTENDKNMSGTEKNSRYMLGMKLVSQSDVIELEVEEVAKIKELIGKVYLPVIVGIAWQLLEKGE